MPKSGMDADNVGMDIPVKFGDSSSNGFRDIWGAVFVSNEQTNIGEAYPNSVKRKAKKKSNKQKADLWVTACSKQANRALPPIDIYLHTQI